jgi:hypothetical protein
MPLNPVYLLLSSRSDKKTPKPYFRIAATELPNLPPRFTGFNSDYKYTNVRVTASGTPLAEEWNVTLEATTQENQQVSFVVYFHSLEEAGTALTDTVANDCKDKAGEGKVRIAWTDVVNGNTVARYCTRESKKVDRKLVERKVWNWWEVIKVKLEHEDIYDIQWHETARIEYLANASRIALLSLKAPEPLSIEEGKELDGLHKKLGFVNIPLADFERVWGFKKKSKEELKKLQVELEEWTEEDKEADEEYRVETRGGCVKLEGVEDDEGIMGVE